MPTTLNYQAIGKILNGKQLPNPRQLVSLASWLIREGVAGGAERQNEGEAVQHLLQLRETAHAESLGIYEGVDEVRGNEIPDTVHPGPTVYRLVADAERRAEQALLSSMLKSVESIGVVAEIVRPDSFSDEKPREVYVALLELYGRHSEISRSSVAAQVMQQTAGRIQVAEYLSSLMEIVTDSTTVYYAKRVVKVAQVRRIALLGGVLTDLAGQSLLAGDEGPDLDSLVDYVEDELQSFMEDFHGLGLVANSLEPVIDEAEGIGKTESATESISSGFSEFDSLRSGFHPGELVILGGASGIGKSTLGLQFLRTCSVKYAGTGFLASLQMHRNEAAMRILAAEGRVPLHHMRSASMTDEGWRRLQQAMPSVSSAPLYIQDEPTHTLQQFIRTCEWLSAFKHLKLALIDSIDLMDMDPGLGSGDYERDLAYMARELRKMAKKLNVPVIALFQTERPQRNRTDRRPELYDIPASLEKYADAVILLHREDAYDRDSPRAGEADLIIAKNRTGPIGSVTLAFQGHYGRFVDMSDS
ncbi:DnaB-like helicase C-terminal domain-containing protein [Streptomyces sp. NPDC005813]|uniref:replicative DNA helicase n=1 Tax=Streptomyces sp. NPDC005813 TaxID=3155592 RepID=UPI0033EF5687